MQLPKPTTNSARQHAEFDVWVTPSLEEVRDTERFAIEMERITRILDIMAATSAGFKDDGGCTPEAIAESFMDLTKESPDTVSERLRDLTSVLFLATGKSDNNAKCQFPLFLRDRVRWPGVPTGKSHSSLVWEPLPRTMKAERVMKQVDQLAPFPEVQRQLLQQYIAFLLASPDDVAQLQSLGRSYAIMRDQGQEVHLLTPLIIFKVRGSVAASGGHLPETLLRAKLAQWGLRAGVDYNLSDVNWTPPAEGRRPRGKTRAWDFIIPYQTPGWEQLIFIQCQFYAGDSGSVSHKNVDQTPGERDRVRRHLRGALFIEFVDGAGYYSALNRDLRHLLEMETTTGFCQLRSVGIRLRCALQEIGFVTPLEVAHATMRVSGDRAATMDLLTSEGYDREEIDRGIQASVEGGHIVVNADETFAVSSRYEATARRYILLDLTARFGSDACERKELGDGLAVPGYGPFRWLRRERLHRLADETMPGSAYGLSEGRGLLDADISWLVREGLAMATTELG